MQMVFVEWYDAQSQRENDWTPVVDCEGELAICYSMGFLIKETELAYTVAGHYSHVGEEEDFAGEIVIPKSCVREFKSMGVLEN